MSRYLSESFFCRLCVAFYGWLKNGFIGRFIQYLGRTWRSSVSYALLARLLCGGAAVENSAFFRLGGKINARLYAMGTGLRRGYEESFYARCALPYMKKSMILRFLFGNGITGLLLTCAASYAIIDYLLRDVFQLTNIASIWDEGFMILCALWILVQRMGSKKPARSRGNAVDLFIALYMVAGILLLVNYHKYLPVNVTGFRASMQYLLMFFLVVRLIRNEGDFMRMYRLMVAIATIIALYGIYQFVVGVEIPSNWTDAAEGSVRTRVFAIFSNPNVMGGYMILFAPMAIGLAYAQEDLPSKIFYWCCGLAMCGACLFTMSRGAWLALAVAAILFALIIDRRLFGILVVGGILACFLPFVRSRIGYLFTAEFQESNQRGGRGVRWDRTFGYLDYFRAWSTGLGYGMYGGAVAMQNKVNPLLYYTYVDNYYVKILAENGIAGLSALLTMLSGLLWNGARSIAACGKSEYRPLCAGMFVALIGILVQSFFECLWEEPYLMALYFIIAAMLVYAGILRKKDNSIEP